MEVRSTLEFRSNIYPVTAQGRLIYDIDFVASISDPKALVELEKVSRRPPLTELQEWQLKKGKPCLVGDGRYTPWGTKVINGRQEVVCLCEEADCVLFEKCMERHPSVVAVSFVPEVAQLDSRDADASEGNGDSDDALHHADRRVRLGVEERVTTGIYLSGATESNWTPEDDARLKDYFVRYPREILYGFFPEKEVADIEHRIRKVCFSFIPQPTPTSERRKTKPAAHAKSAARKQLSVRPQSVSSGPTSQGRQTNLSSNSARNAAIQEASRKLEAKRKRREELRKRPWEPDEDAILARNYPVHGSNMLLWDQKLFGRKKDAIEERARQLGLKGDGAPLIDRQPPSDSGVSNNAARRTEWEEEMLGAYYDIYGSRWGYWKRILPWLSSSQLAHRALELGHEGVWDYSSKKSFLENEGLDWSVDELNTLLHEYPLTDNGSRKWSQLLPGRTMSERAELASLLGIPSREQVYEHIVTANALL